MTLHEILTEAIRLVGDIGCDHVTIARENEGPHGYQIRFEPDRSQARGYAILGRRWIDQTPTIGKPRPTSARGTVGPYVGWARWSAFMGFGVDSVLATDWVFVR